ncbi:MAG: hypothetical protein KF727_14375 [Microbacteriaceae bacterium]|nr:hypothetical protein [Microbacteriaceae bacterium]
MSTTHTFGHVGFTFGKNPDRPVILTVRRHDDSSAEAELTLDELRQIKHAINQLDLDTSAGVQHYIDTGIPLDVDGEPAFKAV